MTVLIEFLMDRVLGRMSESAEMRAIREAYGVVLRDGSALDKRARLVEELEMRGVMDHDVIPVLVDALERRVPPRHIESLIP